MLDVKKLLTKMLQNQIRFYDTSYSGARTIGASGYTNLGVLLPNNVILSLMVLSWGSSTNAFSLAKASGNAIYLVGAPNTTVTDLAIRVMYK